MKDRSYLVDIIDELKSKAFLDNEVLISFDLKNLYPSISNDKRIGAVRNYLKRRANKTPLNYYIIKDLQVCLKYYNSRFCSQNLLQVYGIDIYQEMKYFGQHRHDCLPFSTIPLEKFELFLIILSSTDSNLQFTMEAGGNKLSFLNLK